MRKKPVPFDAVKLALALLMAFLLTGAFIAACYQEQETPCVKCGHHEEGKE